VKRKGREYGEEDSKRKGMYSIGQGDKGDEDSLIRSVEDRNRG